MEIGEGLLVILSTPFMITSIINSNCKQRGKYANKQTNKNKEKHFGKMFCYRKIIKVVLRTVTQLRITSTSRLIFSHKCIIYAFCLTISSQIKANAGFMLLYTSTTQTLYVLYKLYLKRKCTNAKLRKITGSG